MALGIAMGLVNAPVRVIVIGTVLQLSVQRCGVGAIATECPQIRRPACQVWLATGPTVIGRRLCEQKAGGPSDWTLPEARSANEATA